MSTRHTTMQTRNVPGRKLRITHVLAALLGLSIVLGSCYWQPDSRETNLAIDATVPNPLASGGVGAQQTYSGDGQLIVYVIEESYLLLSPQELNNLFDALEDAQSLSQEELDARYPAARIRTLPLDFAVGTAGSVGLTGLKGDATYVVAVFAEACEGTYLGDYNCLGTWHEAMDYRRQSLPAGETTRVSLRLDDNFQTFSDFLLAEYGFVTDEEPGEVGTARMYTPPTAYSTTLNDGTNDDTYTFDTFVWEYRGIGSDGTQDAAVFHLWWYDSAAWEYSKAQEYQCPDAVNCEQGAGRLVEIVANAGAYVHARVFADPTLIEPPGAGFFDDKVEFMKLYIAGVGLPELVSQVVALDDVPNVVIGVDASSEIVQATAKGTYTGITSVAPTTGTVMTVDLYALIEVP